jgi:SAM-dependent methyltransferase
MFKVRERYFLSGRLALDSIRLSMVAIGKTQVESVLDLPSGYGRVLRWIAAEFPAARLTACDIDPQGVDFCSRVFGATPVYGREDPANIELHDGYDLIWCGSLFTHLALERWDGFLGLFEAALVPGGLLIFTTHGREIALLLRDPERGRTYMQAPDRREDILRGYDTSGAGYRDYAFTDEFRESRSLPRDFGISLTKPSAVSAVIERRPVLRLVTYMEGRVYRGQDVVACVRLPLARQQDTLETLA